MVDTERTGKFLKCPNGFQVSFPNGWTASVQWGWGNYCENRDEDKWNPEFLESRNAELAAFPTGESYSQDEWLFFPEENDVVKGWQNVSQVMSFLNMVSMKENVNV